MLELVPTYDAGLDVFRAVVAAATVSGDDYKFFRNVTHLLLQSKMVGRPILPLRFPPTEPTGPEREVASLATTTRASSALTFRFPTACLQGHAQIRTGSHRAVSLTGCVPYPPLSSLTTDLDSFSITVLASTVEI